jgi:hypothetical protein
MTQLPNIRIAWAAAFLLMLGSEHWSAQNAHAEVRLHKSVATQFSLVFRPCGDTVSLPAASLQRPDAAETRMSSLQTIERSLLRQHSRLALLCPSLQIPGCASGNLAAGHKYVNPQTLSLQTAMWTLPLASIKQLSGEGSVPFLRQAPPLLLTAGYAATALGGNCVVWDLTSSLPAEEASASITSPQSVPVLPMPDPRLLSVLSTYRVSPIASTFGSLQVSAPQTMVTASGSQSELQQPTREGEAVRRWVLAPNVAARLRRDGFQLITGEKVPPASAIRQARLRPGDSGFKAR